MMTRMGTLCATSRLAAVCRRSCSQISRIPASSRIALNSRLSLRASIAAPMVVGAGWVGSWRGGV
jgi:hypothetical protein